MKRKIIIISILISIILLIGGGLWFLSSNSWQLLSPGGERMEEILEKPFKKYEYERLKERGGKPGKIVLERELSKNETFTSYLFSFTSEGKKITGLANIPNTNQRELKFANPEDGREMNFATPENKFPVIVQLRGYVDREIYETGVGTRPSGEVFSSNGFITLAPDYLGYGESDMPPNNVWEERFLRLVSVMDLLSSISSLPQADPDRVGIWGHSNGGLAALTMLVLTGKAYPTTLWAPVTEYFPYDVLYYTWEADDRGKSLRKVLSEFEKDYDTDLYSFDNFLGWINKDAVIQLHQGTGDAYIPMSWSDNFVKKLQDQGLKVDYFTYPGADHNLSGVWDMVVTRDLEFFKRNLISK